MLSNLSVYSFLVYISLLIAYTLSPRSPLSWLDPGVFGTLGVGAGFALAAKCARPNTECWLIYGDGALGMHHSSSFLVSKA